MHLHTHLLDCILDYGPVYSFWLFSFECFNGILGSYHTNQRAIEIQVMRKFLLDFTLKELVSSEEWDASQLSLFGDLYERKQVGSVNKSAKIIEAAPIIATTVEFTVASSTIDVGPTVVNSIAIPASTSGILIHKLVA